MFKYHRALIYLLFVSLLLIGAYNALLLTVHFVSVDADSTDTAMLWYGFHDHGWNFIKTWRYTQDNWLLSLFSWHSLLFYFFPFSPKLIILSGWGIFLADVFLCSYIAYQLGSRVACLLAPILWLFAGSFLYINGSLTYPITHNITFFFGLLAVLFTILWLQKKNKLALYGVFLTIVIGGLSDPWFLPCFSAPFITATFWFMRKKTLPKNESSDWIPLFIVIVIAILLNFTKILGLFLFLSSVAYKVAKGHEILKHIYILIKNAGWYFQVFPGHSSWTALASLLIFFGLISLSILKIRQHGCTTREQLFFFIFAGASLVLLTISFLLSSGLDHDGSLDYFRYFLNFFFWSILGFSLIIEFNWFYLSKISKMSVISVAILYVITGLSTSAPLWKKPINFVSNDQLWHQNFINTMIAHGWSYGYADYINANVFTALSNNRIRVRPVFFENGKMFWVNRKQLSPLWYTSEDIPKDQKTFFIFFHPSVLNKGIQDLNIVGKNLIEQYGPPSQTLPYDDGMIMVWNHPLELKLWQQKL